MARCSLYHLLVVLGVLQETNLGIFAKGNLLLTTSQPSAWGSQRGALLQCHQLPSCNLFTQHSCLSFFGRETSLVNITGPRSIFPPLFTPPLFTAFISFPLQSPSLFPVCLILCKQQDQRDSQPLWTHWEQSYLLLCVGPGQVSYLSQTAPCSFDHLLVDLGVLLVD